MSVVICPACGTKNRVDPHRAQSSQPVCGKCGTTLPAAPTTPVNVTDADFDSVVLSSNKPTLVDCWAPWCGPCRMVAPVIDELAAESNGRYLIAKLNVDDNPTVAQRYRISSIPTMLLFANGKLVDQIVGLQPKQALAARLRQYA